MHIEYDIEPFQKENCSMETHLGPTHTIQHIFPILFKTGLTYKNVLYKIRSNIFTIQYIIF